MFKIIKEFYNWINTILANHLVVVIIVIPIISFLIRRFIEKRDNKNQIKKEKVYIPLYNMFYNIENEYVYNQELNDDFDDMDLQAWWDISNCEKILFVDKKLKDLMDKFVDNHCEFIEKWKKCVKSVIEQYNNIAKEVNGLEELCTEERKSFIMDYDREILLMQKFTFTLIFKKYDMAFDYIVPAEDWHKMFSLHKDEEKKDPHDLVLENKNNIISLIKNIKIEDEMLESYNSFKNDEKAIMNYLSKRIK